MMRIITGAKPYIDIDAYAGIIAFAELLNLQGIPAKGGTTSTLNGSITPAARDWGGELLVDPNFKPADDDTFTIIDVANYEALDAMVDIDRVDEIIDHHPGFNAFWQARLGDKADLAMVGAACTLVFEHWERAGLVDQMSQTSARLLICGLLDNTLNFKARITTDRDHHAHSELLKRANLPDSWTEQYFNDCQQQITANPLHALQDDTKLLPLQKQIIPASQIVVWDAAPLLHHLPELIAEMGKAGPAWMINIVSIKEGHNHIVCADQATQKTLAAVVGTPFQANVAVTDRLWLRKELFLAANGEA